MPTYDIYPAVDSGYNFPPEIRQALVLSTDIQAALTSTKSSAVSQTKSDIQPTFDGINTNLGTLNTAITNRQYYSFRWADATARGNQTGMREGDRGIQLDTGYEYEYVGSAWVYRHRTTVLRTKAQVTAITGVPVGTQIPASDGITYRWDGTNWKAWVSDWVGVSITLYGANGAYGATPGWLSSGASARYINGMAQFRGNVSLNSGGSTFSSAISVSLPLTASTAVGASPKGTANAYNASDSYAPYTLQMTTDANKVYFYAVGVTGSGAARMYGVGGTTPFGEAWAQSDIVNWDFLYDLA